METNFLEVKRCFPNENGRKIIYLKFFRYVISKKLFDGTKLIDGTKHN